MTLKRLEEANETIAKLRQAPNAWNELRDLYGFIVWACEEQKDPHFIVENIGHDLRGLVNNEPCFSPRSSGYYKTMKARGFIK